MNEEQISSILTDASNKLAEFRGLLMAETLAKLEGTRTFYDHPSGRVEATIVGLVWDEDGFLEAVLEYTSPTFPQTSHIISIREDR